jgi:hypothetical protein
MLTKNTGKTYNKQVLREHSTPAVVHHSSMLWLNTILRGYLKWIVDMW